MEIKCKWAKIGKNTRAHYGKQGHPNLLQTTKDEKTGFHCLQMQLSPWHLLEVFLTYAFSFPRAFHLLSHLLVITKEQVNPSTE